MDIFRIEKNLPVKPGAETVFIQGMKRAGTLFSSAPLNPRLWLLMLVAGLRVGQPRCGARC